MFFQFECTGHLNIISKHKTTLEFTTESDLSLQGDCIIGVNSTQSLASLPQELKEKMRIMNSQIVVKIRTADLEEVILGNGHPDLTFSDKHAIIIRKSDFICPRTLMINSNKAACDISIDIVQLMRNPKNILTISIQVD